MSAVESSVPTPSRPIEERMAEVAASTVAAALAAADEAQMPPNSAAVCDSSVAKYGQSEGEPAPAPPARDVDDAPPPTPEANAQ